MGTNDRTGKKLATVASRILRGKYLPTWAELRAMAASLLNQSPNKPKKPAAKKR